MDDFDKALSVLKSAMDARQAGDSNFTHARTRYTSTGRIASGA
jgi:hypothetical protein